MTIFGRWLGNAHSAVRDSLSAYLDGALNLSERRRVEEHLAGCMACGQELEGLRAVKRTLQALPEATPRRSFTLRRADVGAVPPPVRTSARWGLSFAFARLASGTLAALLVLLVGFDLITMPRPSTPSESRVAVSMSESAAGGAPAQAPVDAASAGAFPTAAQAPPGLRQTQPAGAANVPSAQPPAFSTPSSNVHAEPTSVRRVTPPSASLADTPSDDRPRHRPLLRLLQVIVGLSLAGALATTLVLSRTEGNRP